MFEPSYSTYANYGGQDKWRNIFAIILVVSMTLVGGGWLFAKELETTFDAQAGDTKNVFSLFDEKVAAFRNSSSSDAQVLGDQMVNEVIEPVKMPEVFIPYVTTKFPNADTFTAHSIVVKDAKTNTLLYGKNEYAPVPIASITKLISALVILDHDLDMSREVIALETDMADTHIVAGGVYSLDELWQAALVGSSNRAIATLARETGLPEDTFAHAMNEKAQSIGMLDAQFVEPTGLDARNVASAADVVILLKEALRYKEIASTLLEKKIVIQEASSKKYEIWNTSWLLLGWIPNDFDEYYGGKTGYIPASGYNFAMNVGKDGVADLLVVVLGAQTHEARFTEANDIADWIFENTNWGSSDVETLADSTATSTIAMDDN